MDRPLRTLRARRGARSQARHPILSGVLALLLVSMLAATAAVGGQPSATRAQVTTLETASVTPESALVYAAVTTDETSLQWQQSLALAERAGLGSVMDELMAEAAMAGEGADLSEVEPFLGGEIAFVLTTLDVGAAVDIADLTGGLADPTALDTDAPSGFALIIQASDPVAAWTAAEETTREDAAFAGVEVTETIYNGATILSVEPGPFEDSGTAIAQVGDFVIFASLPADLEPIIDTHAGAIAPLSGLDSFTSVQGVLSDEFLLFGYVNGPAFGEALAADPEFSEFAALTGTDMDALEAHTGFVVWADAAGFRIDTMSIPLPGATLPPMPQLDPTLAERVSGDTLLFVNGTDLNATGALDALGLLIAQGMNDQEPGVIPPGVDPDEYAAQQYEQAGQLLGFNLQTDFLQQLVGEFGFSLALGDLGGLFMMDTSGIGMLFVTGVDNQLRVADAISKISFIAQAAGGETTTVSTREVPGGQLTVIEDTSAGVPLRVEFGVVDGELVLGLGDSVDAYLAGPAQSLADNPQYNEVLAALPAEYGAIVYVDLSQVVTIFEEFSGMMGGDFGLDIEDSHPDCAQFATQEEAQEAYDQDPFEWFELDQNFDGIACGDYFADSFAEPAPEEPDFSAIRAFAMVSFEQDGMVGTSSILYISDE